MQLYGPVDLLAVPSKYTTPSLTPYRKVPCQWLPSGSACIVIVVVSAGIAVEA